VPLVALAAAALAMPATASATLTPVSSQPSPDPAYGTHDVDGNPVVNMTADNILGPNEDLLVAFPFADDGADESGAPMTFPGGNGVLSRTDDSDLNVITTSRAFGPNDGGYVTNATSGGGSGYFQLHTGSQLVCGTTVPLKLDLSSVSQPAFNKSYTYRLPTGVRGAFRRNASNEIGQVATDGSTFESKVDVSSQGGKIRGLRVHIDSLEHRWSTYWLEVALISPSGKKVMLMAQQGSLDANVGARPKSLTNVTFSDETVGGQTPKDAADALAAGYSNIVMQPKESLSAFDGENVDGNWKLQVHDVSQPLSNRSSRGRAYSWSGNEMAQLGSWQLDTANALCTGTPQAWFGGDAGPLVLNPAGGTLDASDSHDPSLNGSIATYQWDLDGNAGNGFEVTTSSPTVPYGAVSSAPYTRDINLRVVDNEGNTSDVVTRTAIFSNKPVIGGVLLSPTTPVAGQEVTLTGSATDADVGDTFTYSWDLNGDGTYGDMSGDTVKWTYPFSGPQVIRLKVTDSRGASAYYWQNLTIANTNPVARLTYAPQPAVVGQTVTLNAGTSTDADGTIVKYGWDLDGNGTMDDVITQTATTTTTFSTPGEHIVRVEVTDNTGGTNSVDLPIWVTGPPVGVISATPNSPLIGETVTFSAAQSHDSDAGGSITKYEWDLDGNSSYEVSGATATTATKSYPNAGTVVIRLRLTDNDGATSVTTFALNVRSATSGGGGGGGGTPTPTPVPTKTPTPTATPSPGVVVPEVKIDGGGVIKGAVVQGDEETDGNAWWDGSADPPDAGVKDGFAAKLAAAAKQPGKKAYKKGVAVALTASAPGKVAVKATIDGKLAKKLGIKTKAKVLSIGAGTLVMKKGGTSKFYVRFNKKYAAKVKKQKALTVMLRGLVTSAEGTKLAVSRKVTIVK
jgi:subtilisin-like proprotein convertase family protein